MHASELTRFATGAYALFDNGDVAGVVLLYAPAQPGHHPVPGAATPVRSEGLVGA